MVTPGGENESDIDKAIVKHLKSLGVQHPNAYLLSIKRKIGFNDDAIAKAWREWKTGGINSKSHFYDRCLHHAGKVSAT